MYDAVIVGAGPAGLCTGGMLAKAGWSVCIVDRRRQIGLPVRCGEATGNREELARFLPVDEAWIAGDVRGFALHHLGDVSLAVDMPDAGVVLHRDRFEQALAEQARRSGAEILLETPVTGLAPGGEAAGGVVCAGGRVIEGGVVVGADGPESNVGRWAGITGPLALREVGTSAQYRVRSGAFHDGRLHFFMGESIIAEGYLWVFPKSPDELSVGVGSSAYGPGQRRPLEALDAFIAGNMAGAEKSSLITGAVPLAISPRKLHRGNVLVVGDAARQVNPLSGGGIMNSLSASSEAVAALLGRRRGQAWETALGRYDRAWDRRYRRTQKVYLLLKESFYKGSDAKMERMFHEIRAAFPGTIDRSVFKNFPVLKILKISLSFMPEFGRTLPVLFR